MKCVAVNSATPSHTALTTKLSVGSSKWILPNHELFAQFSSMKFSTLPKFGNLKSFQKPQLPFDPKKEYDLVVIGGGTGGITAALEAKKLGLSVAMFDYVDPSPQGSKWGLGGTCVNVGCIPKKLFHISAQTHENYKSASDFGWKVDENKKTEHDWVVLKDNIQNYIKGINFSYVKKMSEAGIHYINA